MAVGLSGPHRTGKSTLAQAFAEKFDVPFVRTSGTEVFKMLGKDPKVDYPIEERIAIQEAILHAFEQQYADASKRSSMWISDRTPIDLASYMLADIQRGTFEGSVMGNYVNNYVHRCLTSTNRWFTCVILVQPGIKVVEAEGKAPGCPAYIEHLNMLQKGLLLEDTMLTRQYMIPRRITNLEDRIESVANAIDHTIEFTEQMHTKREQAGVSLH